jgi:HlyD family secretion protein
MMTRMLMTLLVAAVAVQSGCGSKAANDQDSVLASYTVTRGDLEISISESGSLRSAKATDVVARTKGWITYVIPDGTRVKEGEVLMELENSERIDKLERARLDREEALRSLAQAKADLQLHELETAKRLADADRKLRFAKLELEQYEQGTAPLKENELGLKVERGQILHEQEEERLERMPALLEQGFVTQAELENTQLKVRELRQDLETHQSNLDVFVRFERPKELARLQADIEASEIQVERDRQSVIAERAQKEAEVKKHQYASERKTEEVSELEEHVRNLVIKAPSRGIVVHGNPKRRHWEPAEAYEIGDEVNWNRTVMSLPDLTDMICEVGINEVYIDKVTDGMPARTRVESLGETFVGEVRKIAATANQRYDVKEYKAEVTLGETGGRTFRPGMSARVTILVDSLEQVLTVPLDAVYQREGETYVYVEAAAGPERRAVTVGQSNDNFVVVTEGVQEGERVLVLAIEPGEA